MGIVSSSLVERRDPNLNANPIIFSKPVAGIRIDERTALTYGAVWACVRVISGFIMSFPWKVYRARPDGGRDHIPKHPVNKILSEAPNTEMTSKAWTRSKVADLCTWGNGFSEIDRAKGISKEIGEVYPIEPDRVKVVRDPSENLWYEVRNDKGPNKMLRPDQVFHARGLGHNPLVGYSVIRMARETISLGLAAQRFGAAFFGNGARPSMTFEHPTHFETDDDKTEFEEDLKRAYGGGNTQGAMVLQNGMTAKVVSVPPEEAQFLETRQFQVNDIGIWYGVPPVFLGDYDRAKFNNMEQMSIQLAYGLMMYIVSLESEADWKLFTPEEREQGYYTRISMNGLLRADTKTRGEFYKVMRDLGAWNVNRILELEDENPIGPEGDLRLVPLNMVSLEKAYRDDGTAPQSEVTTTQPKASPAPARKQEEEEEATERALRPVFKDAVTRLLRKEIKAARRGAEKSADAEAFAGWMMEFYGEFRGQIIESIKPACESLWGLNSKAEMSKVVLYAAAEEWIDESREGLGDAFRRGVESIGILLEDWEAKRHFRIAEDLEEHVKYQARRKNSAT